MFIVPHTVFFNEILHIESFSYFWLLSGVSSPEIRNVRGGAQNLKSFILIFQGPVQKISEKMIDWALDECYFLILILIIIMSSDICMFFSANKRLP